MYPEASAGNSLVIKHGGYTLLHSNARINDDSKETMLSICPYCTVSPP